MEDRNYGINWVGLVIKVIAFVVVLLLAIWLISKLSLKEKGLSFEENNDWFKDATIEYFENNIPIEENKKKVTLKQLINEEYLEELKDEEGKLCNQIRSISKLETFDGYYNIKSVFVCGNKRETTYIKLGNENCEDCDIRVEGLEINNAEGITNVNQDNYYESSISNNSYTQNAPTQTLLYEYVRENIDYSDWYVGKVTGNNIENSVQNVNFAKYVKNEIYTYRTVGYVTRKQNYTYTLELENLANKELSSLTLHSTNYFEQYQDYVDYLDYSKNDLDMVGSSEGEAFTLLPSVSSMQNSSLNSNNFTYHVSGIYEEYGRYYVDVTVNVKNLYGINPYYAYDVQNYVYFVPIKFTISFIDETNCIIAKVEDQNKYSNYTIIERWQDLVDVYRYKNTISEYKYSPATSLEGYTKTGKTKLAS